MAETETEAEGLTLKQRTDLDLQRRAERGNWAITEDEFRKMARTGEFAPAPAEAK